MAINQLSKLKGYGVTAYSVHPGAVLTDFLRNAKEHKGFWGYVPTILYMFYPIFAIFLKSVKDGKK